MSSKPDRVKAFISSTYGQDTPYWGVYQNKKTGVKMASPKQPCKCAWDTIATGLSKEDALAMTRQ